MTRRHFGAATAQFLPQLVRADRSQRARDRKEVFRAWLEARRSEISETLPGEYFLTAWQLLVVLSALVGAGLGMSVAAALLLAYTGDEPVNVAWFFACTVGIQWLILTALLIWLLRRTTHLFENFRPFAQPARRAALVFERCPAAASGERRERMRARLMGIRRKGEVFQLLVWPLLMITQIFGVFFNVGVLIALLLPFGQRRCLWLAIDLKTSPETVYSWFPRSRLLGLSSTAHPTREDVVQSRFSYSEGIHSLSLPAMTSWWPFLLYATIFYGLLVRMCLLLWCA